jgi:hypothetical protein
MGVLKCDERGRLVLPQAVRERYGEAFYLARARDRLMLIPAAKDPVKDLEEIGKKLPRTLSAHELKKHAKHLALRELLEEQDRTR